MELDRGRLDLPQMTLEAPQLTEDEAALYDRQIRLWGLNAQRRIRAARVLVAGLGGVGAEVGSVQS